MHFSFKSPFKLNNWFRPIVLFWAYYAIGPLLSLDRIKTMSGDQYLFPQGELTEKIFYHLVSFLLILPVVWICGTYDFRSHVKLRFTRLKLLVFMRLLVISLSVFFTYHFISLWPNFFLLDFDRALIYVEWIDSNHIMPLALLAIFLVYPFLNNRWIFSIAIPLAAIDIIMGRRHLIGLFLLPIIMRLRIKWVIFLIGVIGLITSMRHGLDHIASSLADFTNALFSESYMIMLSSSSHGSCNISLGSINAFLYFERYTEYCRQLNYAAGGFAARMQYSPIFGLISVIIFSSIVVAIFVVGKRYINIALHEAFGIVLFESFFILYRDDMGNSLVFMLKYSSLLMVFSALIYVLGVAVVQTHEYGQNRK